MTTCLFLSVKDLTLEVVRLDAIDSPPVLDTQPYVREFARAVSVASMDRHAFRA